MPSSDLVIGSATTAFLPSTFIDETFGADWHVDNFPKSASPSSKRGDFWLCYYSITTEWPVVAGKRVFLVDTDSTWTTQSVGRHMAQATGTKGVKQVGAWTKILAAPADAAVMPVAPVVTVTPLPASSDGPDERLIALQNFKWGLLLLLAGLMAAVATFIFPASTGLSSASAILAFIGCVVAANAVTRYRGA